MTYRQNLDDCFAAAIGDRGLSASAWVKALERAGEAMATIRRWHAEDSLPLLRLGERRDDLAACRAAAKLLTSGATDIVHFGTGGSSLGAQALAQLAGYRVPGSRLSLGLDERPRLHFFDNLDAATLTAALANFDLDTTRFLVVSKSGGTPETLAQLLAALDALTAGGGRPRSRPSCRCADRAGRSRRQCGEGPCCPPRAHRPRPRSGCRWALFGADQCRHAAGAAGRPRPGKDPCRCRRRHG